MAAEGGGYEGRAKKEASRLERERKHLQQNLAGTKVIVVTAKTYDFDRRAAAAVGADGYLTKPLGPDFLSQLEALERDAIIRSLIANDGHKGRAAKSLGMSRATIYRKIHDYGVQPP